MKETGIIYSGSHPVDVLDGRKDMTRRTRGLNRINEFSNHWMRVGSDSEGRYSFRNIHSGDVINIRCPYGEIGSRLWGKETYLEDFHGFHSYLASYYEPHPLVTPEAMLEGIASGMYWKKPSIFMPRKYSRISQEITELRVEQVQALTEADAVREGCRGHHTHQIKGIIPAFDNRMLWTTAYEEYRRLWDKLNEKRGYGWNKNPWVWVIGAKLLPLT